MKDSVSIILFILCFNIISLYGQIYQPRSFESSKVEYVETYKAQKIDMSSLDRLSNTHNNLFNQRLAEIDNAIKNAKTDNDWKIINLKIKSLQETMGSSQTQNKSLSRAARKKEILHFKDKTVVKNPEISSGYNASIEVVQVDLENRRTVLHIRYIGKGYTWININKAASIIDSKVASSTNHKIIRKSLLGLKKAKGIKIAPKKTSINKGNQIVEFQLVFPKIEDGTKTIDLIECESNNCFNVKGIKLY